MKIQASYFDGKTSRRYDVELFVKEGTAHLSGTLQRTCPIAQLHFPEQIRTAARKLVFPDGAYLETTDVAGFDAIFTSTGHKVTLAVRAQRSWNGALAACIITLAILAVGYVYGLPAVSEAIAKSLPEKVQHAIGRETLAFLDRHLFAPTALSEERRTRITERFKGMTLPASNKPDYEILFRKSRVGPNAFALPSGQIVLTDEIVDLVNDDEAVMGILAHEMGHLHERHLLRRLIQGSVVGLATTFLFGDVSSVVAAIPAIMVELKYSRDAEREADDYAIAMLKANGISPSRLSLVFEKLGEKQAAEVNAYLSSHPPVAERIKRIQQAQ